MTIIPSLPEMKFVGIDPARCGLEGRRMSYLEAGDKSAPPLFVMHGIGSNANGWRFVLDALKERYRVIAWNAPGYMLSDNLKAEKPSNFQYADAAAAFLDALEIEEAFVVGSSFGSMVAASFAARHPTRVRRLMLSGASRGHGYRTPQEREAVLNSRKASIRDGALAMAELRWSNLIAPHSSEQTVRLVRELLKATNPRGFLQAAEALVATDVTAFAGQITAPTLLAIGTLDILNPPEVSRTISGAIPGSRVVELDGVGHLPKLEAPDLFSRLIDDHMGEK